MNSTREITSSPVKSQNAPAYEPLEVWMLPAMVEAKEPSMMFRFTMLRFYP